MTENAATQPLNLPATEPVTPDYGRFTPAPDRDDPAHFPPGTFIEHDGHRFRVAEQIGLMPLMDYAEVAEQGVDSDALAGLTAMLRLLRALIDTRDWQRFHAWTVDSRVTGDTIAIVIGKAMEVVGSRETPTGSPSGSPGGASTTGPSSSVTSGAAASPDDAWTQRKRALGLRPVGEG